MARALPHKTTAKRTEVSNIVQGMMGHDVQIDVHHFHQYCQEHSEVCLMLLDLQATLRERLLGTPYWRAIAKRRSRNPEQHEPGYIREVFREMQAAREEGLRARREGAKAALATNLERLRSHVEGEKRNHPAASLDLNYLVRVLELMLC